MAQEPMASDQNTIVYQPREPGQANVQMHPYQYGYKKVFHKYIIYLRKSM